MLVGQSAGKLGCKAQVGAEAGNQLVMEDGKEARREAKAYVWTFGNAEFDEGRWRLKVAGQEVELERRPLEVLQYLLRHAGEAVTKEELLASVWAGRIVVEAVLTNAVGKLRKALGEHSQDIIATLPKVGYRLSVPTARKPAEFVPRASCLAVGDTVPRRANWRLETPLSRAEGNEVWLARHVKTQDVRVFKFSLAGNGLASLKREVVIARLLREALGEREDFVQLLDWDFDEAPYYIESAYGGVSLDRWEADGGIATVPLARRLAMFAGAAEAIAAAHSIGVLHKDIKPGNLLVVGEGDEARLRVADFGSSRLLDSGVLDQLGITHLGSNKTQAIEADSGTPLYLAPELASGQSATVRSDVYALGVTLYQLLIGDFRRPLAPGWERDIDDKLLREDIAAAANGDPSLRLDSAAALAERIRSLEDRREKRALEMAVLKRVEEGEKRLAKIRARRPWLVATMAALVLAVGILGWLLPRAWRSERIAIEQRNIAEEMNRFVTEDILGAANPLASGSATLTVRDALERSSSKIDARFPGQPGLVAQLHAVVAGAYYQLSDYASAAQHFRKSHDFFARVSGSNSADAIDQQIMLAESLARSGQVREAEKLLAGLPARIDSLGPERRYQSKINYDRAQAWSHWAAGSPADAVPPLEDAVATLALLADPDPQLELEIRQALLTARATAGLPTIDLVRLQETAIEKLQQSHNGKKMPLLMSARYGMLRLRMLAGEERTLEADYQGMIAELTETLGPRNEATLLAMHGLAHIYTKQERWSECQQQADRVRAGLLQLLGPSNIQSVNANNTQGVCLLGLGEYRKARDLFLQALTSFEGEDGIKAELVRTVMQVNLGHAYAELGEWEALRTLLPQIRKSGAKLLKANSDALGEFEMLEGRLAASDGNIEAARMLIQSAIVDLSRKNPSEYWLIRMGRRELAKLMPRTSEGA